VGLAPRVPLAGLGADMPMLRRRRGDRRLAAILRDAGVEPVLVDIGASGATPRIWDPIAPASMYVGFDPDRREVRDSRGRYRRAVLVDRAVTDDAACTDVPFYLTRAPYCSSTLMPATESLAEYLFSELFEVEQVVRVPATTLAAVVREFGLKSIDWLKTDSQGTDLRLLRSLPKQIGARVLAVDVEPGLIGAYCGEDLFSEVHEEMVDNGFWLSDLHVKGAVRLRVSTARAFPGGADIDGLASALRKSPGWVEARYLRQPQWLAESGCGPREYLVSWVFALLDGQAGFALDLAAEYRQKFPSDPLTERLTRETLRRTAGAFRRATVLGKLARGVRKLRRWGLHSGITGS